MRYKVNTLQKVPALSNNVRPETGPMQFGDDDWPGVFIRGDNALVYLSVVRAALGMLEHYYQETWVIRNYLENLAELFESAHARNHNQQEKE